MNGAYRKLLSVNALVSLLVAVSYLRSNGFDQDLASCQRGEM